MLDFNNSQSKIVNIDREGKALQRCNLSARPMPEDGQGRMLSHMLLPSRSSFGYKAINLLSWCEAPIRVKQAKSSAPVGHMSVFSIRSRNLSKFFLPFINKSQQLQCQYGMMLVRIGTTNAVFYR